MEHNQFIHAIEAHTKDCYNQMPILDAILNGTLSSSDLRKLAARHYAEVRTFIELKLPERIRICPRQAYSAKRFFVNIYCEEQGNFYPGADHAEMFKLVCYKLGLSDQELEVEFKSYWPRYKYLLAAQPSYEALARELAISYAWESFIIKAGRGFAAALSRDYGLTVKDLIYFTVHSSVDEKHSNDALELVAEYVTDEALAQVALDAITDTLVTNNYLK
jgi:pyrroloquinoline quinone (PQQ) biosynthesis protein C